MLIKNSKFLFIQLVLSECLYLGIKLIYSLYVYSFRFRIDNFIPALNRLETQGL